MPFSLVYGVSSLIVAPSARTCACGMIVMFGVYPASGLPMSQSSSLCSHTPLTSVPWNSSVGYLESGVSIIPPVT